MPKFNIQFDTENNDVTFTVDGEIIGADSYSIGRYTYLDCDNNLQLNNCISFTVKNDVNTSITYSYNYDSRTKELTQMNYTSASSLSNQISRVINNSLSADKLSKALSKKDPVAIINLEKRSEVVTKLENSQLVTIVKPENNDRNPYRLAPPVTNVETDKNLK